LKILLPYNGPLLNSDSYISISMTTDLSVIMLCLYSSTTAD